jgi:hypothetical protein
MLRELVLRLTTLGLAAVVVGGSSARGQDPPIETVVAEPLSITRVYSDSEGESHFSVLQVPFELKDYAPPAPPMSVTDLIKTDGFVVISSPGGWSGDWHPAPRRQYMVCLSGTLEVKVTDGEVRRFGPGSVLLVEDTTGKGHVSRVVGKERGYMIALPIKEDR